MPRRIQSATNGAITARVQQLPRSGLTGSRNRIRTCGLRRSSNRRSLFAASSGSHVSSKRQIHSPSPKSAASAKPAAHAGGVKKQNKIKVAVASSTRPHIKTAIKSVITSKSKTSVPAAKLSSKGVSRTVQNGGKAKKVESKARGRADSKASIEAKAGTKKIQTSAKPAATGRAAKVTPQQNGAQRPITASTASINKASAATLSSAKSSPAAKSKLQPSHSSIVLPDNYRPTDAEPFMNGRQRAYFRIKLLNWKEDIARQTRETLQGMHDETIQYADIADRATSETDRALELRARDRQRKLIAKIDAALARIEDGTYGYCEETGEPIGLKRLDARPIATLSLEAQERHERRERIHRED